MQGIKIDIGDFCLRSLSTADNLKNYLYWMSNPQNNKFIISAHKNYSLKRLRQFIEACNSDKNAVLLGIFDIHKDVHVGNIKFDHIDLIDRKATMGILIGEKDYRAKGLAERVITAGIKWLNENLGITYIYLGVDEENLIAVNLYSKIGFETIKTNHSKGIYMILNIASDE
jgi:ribosomal-protein-alanine N-acetyltransferase